MSFSTKTKTPQELEDTKPRMKQKIGFIGSGQMSEALIGGLINSKAATKEQICSSNPSAYRRDILAEKFGIKTFKDNLELLEECDIIVLAIKPHFVDTVLYEIVHKYKKRHSLISIAAGKKIASIEHQTNGDKVSVARLVVNTPALLGEMAGAYSMGRWSEEKDAENAQIIMDACGVGYQLPEHLLDAVTGLSASGPAYVYMFIEALADGGVKQGIPRKMALQLAAQTVLGASKMVKDL